MNIVELEHDIKKELRASMNGILSARMREAGMPFKLIFGVELPRLQSIADEFPKDKDLANQLWSENIRETKLLAIMLMPPEEFTFEVANEWKESMVTPEEAQILAMKLLSMVNHAKEISLAWMQGVRLNEEEQVFSYCKRLLPEASLHLKKAIQALMEAFEAVKN